MEFQNRLYRYRRPLAAREDTVIEGVEYSEGQYIDWRKHRNIELRRAYHRKKIGHPVEAWMKDEFFGLDVVIDKTADDAKEKVVLEDTIEKSIKLHDHGRGWYDVLVNGEVVNEKKLREDDAKALMLEISLKTED